MAQRRLSAADDRKIRRLHGRGESRNAIAKAIACSPATISRALTRLGLDITREAPRAGIEARSIDLAARRQALAEKLLDDAERLRAQMWEPCKAFAFGGRDNVYAEHELTEPPPAEKLSLLRAASGAVQASMRLDEAGKGVELASARSMLAALADGLAAAAGSER